MEKFTRSVETGCWEWSASKNNKGYGLIWSPEDGKKILAHRFSYRHFVDSNLGAGQVVLHSCDNPGCVNPGHLSAGTKKDNSIDAARKGRSGGMMLPDAKVISLLRDYIAGLGHREIAAKYGISVRSVPDFTGGSSRAWLHGKHGCPSLEELKAAKNRKPGAKVTTEIAIEIRRRLASGELGKDLAQEYGLHKATISDIKLRKIWADV